MAMTAQNWLTVIESDLLVTAGPQLVQAIQNFGTAAGDPLKLTAAWIGLQGALLADLPQFESTLAQQISAALQAKLQAAVAAAVAKASGGVSG